MVTSRHLQSACFTLQHRAAHLHSALGSKIRAFLAAAIPRVARDAPDPARVTHFEGMARTYSCGILGATGIVGQTFILLLRDHPFLRVDFLGASPASKGKRYGEAAKWKMSSPIPERVAALPLVGCTPEEFKGAEVVFSASSDDVAGALETTFLHAGFRIFSNAKNFRRQGQTPLVVPLVNCNHIDEMVPIQRKTMDVTGSLVANANCSVTGLVVALKALQDRFGAIIHVSVVTMQAVSGGGYPGVASMDIMDNVVPFISGEEEKIEYETSKILGGIEQERFTYLPNLTVSAQCNRVPVLDGHLECVSVKFATPPSSVEAVEECLRQYKCPVQILGCPSAPKTAIHVFSAQDRPQPRLDRDLEGGFACSVGRIRKDPIFDIKFVVLSHNTVLGAAGSGVLLAEYCILKGVL